MDCKIRSMTASDEAEILAMMQVFYASPAVHTNGSEAIFRRDIAACVTGSPYLAGYVFDRAGEILGYAMLAKSFSTEFGRPCVWIEDLYLKESARGLGLGSGFFDFLKAEFPEALLRLEVEEENRRAVHVYSKAGFGVLPYMEMYREP